MQLVKSAVLLMAVGLFFVIGQKLLGQAGHIGNKSWGLLK